VRSQTLSSLFIRYTDSNVRSGCKPPEDQPQHGLPRSLPHCRYAAGQREASQRACDPTIHAIEESVDLAHEVYNRVFRRVPERLNQK
jgi:hypothetical protein